MLKDFRESGDILVRGSGNYASDEQKEIARIKREWLNRFKIRDYMSPDEFERVYKKSHTKAELLAG